MAETEKRILKRDIQEAEKAYAKAVRESKCTRSSQDPAVCRAVHALDTLQQAYDAQQQAKIVATQKTLRLPVYIVTAAVHTTAVRIAVIIELESVGIVAAKHASVYVLKDETDEATIAEVRRLARRWAYDTNNYVPTDAAVRSIVAA